MISPARLACLVLLVVGAVAACGDGPLPGVSADGRRDLFLDQARLELLEGYEGYRALVIEHDAWVNPDRDELALPLFRNGRFRWHVGARPGRFVSGVTRLGVGPGADDTSCELRVTALDADGQPLAGEQGRWQVPALAADPQAPADRWHEGPRLDLELALPSGAATLEFQFVTPLPVPDGSNVALLSPRVEQQPLLAPTDAPLRYDEELRLSPSLDPGEEVPWRPFCGLRLAEGVDPVHQRLVPEDGVAKLPHWSLEGAFHGADGRTGLALLGETGLSLELPLLTADSTLRTALALDSRLGPGTRAEALLAIDGEELLRAEIDSSTWREVAVPLGAFQGAGKRLELSVLTQELSAVPVPSLLPDFGAGVFVPVEWHGPSTARVGFADLRVTRPRSVPRRPARADRPSVVIVHVETLRADTLGQVDADGALIAPQLTALARAGQHFSRAMSPSPWTVPSTATLLTGLPPDAHGMTRHDRAFMPAAAVTLAERARAAGVVTSAVVTNDLVRRHAGWERGFVDFAQVPYANARQVTDLGRSLMGREAGQQQLLFLHYWDPHGPYAAPEAWRERYVEAGLRGRDYRAAEHRAAYDPHTGPGPLDPGEDDVRLLRQRYLGDVAYLDEHVGRMLDAIIVQGLADRTSVIVTADHGEEFFEHGLFGHGNQIYDESVHVPLIVARAGAWAEPWQAARAAAQAGPPPGDARVVSTGALAAEVLELLGVPYVRDELLLSLAASADAGVATMVTEKGVARLGEDDPFDPFRRRIEAARDGGHLLLVHHPVPQEADAQGTLPPPRREFFDLAADPEALRPLPARGAAAEALNRRLDEQRAWAEQHRLPGLEGDMDLSALSKLGYIQVQGR